MNADRKGEEMSSEITSSLNSTIADEVRLKNYRSQIEQKNDIELRDLEARHAEDLQKVLETSNREAERLRRDYDVKISQEAEMLEEKLHQIRIKNEIQINAEKESGENEVSKL